MIARFAVLALAIGLGGCALDSGSVTSDAGPPDGCRVLVTFTPSFPVVDQQVTLTSVVDVGDLFGIIDYSWSVELSGQSVMLTDQSIDGDIVSFTPTEVGPVSVVASASVGDDSCIAGTETINIVPANAQTTTFRLRVVPLAGSGAPIQDRLVTVFGGVPSYDLGELSLDSGIAVSGIATGPGAAPIAVYWRATRLSPEPLAVEGFASADGTFDALLPFASYDVLVVPSMPSLAPVVLQNVAATSLGSSIVVPAGISIGGTVSDGAGQPIAGASVSMIVSGVPSAIATTNGSGAFTVAARAGMAPVIEVVPPASSGLPTLIVSAGPLVTVSDGSTIAIDYSAALTTRSIAPSLLSTSGGPAAGARVTFISRPIAAAATISIDGAAPLSAVGGLRVSETANGAGIIASRLLTEAVYDVVVEPAATAPASEGVSVSVVDLSTGMAAPSTLALVAPATVVIDVREPGFSRVAGARVRATPTGVATNSLAGSSSGITADNGMTTLFLAAGVDYNITIDGGADRGYGRKEISVTAPAAGQSLFEPPVILPDTLELNGVLRIAAGAPLSGALLQLHCTACSSLESARPIAESTADTVGGFTLVVPDPGVGL